MFPIYLKNISSEFEVQSCKYKILIHFFLNSSIIRSGLGWVLCVIGILSFVVIFHCKLHSIQEATQNTRNDSWITMSRFKYVFALIIANLSVSIFFLIFNFDDNQEIIFLNVFLLFHVAILFIFLMRYISCQNSNFKLYLSVYHHHPPPVLPWQLPQNFDPTSVKLKLVLHKNE